MNTTLAEREPALLIGVITAAVVSIVALLVAFGIDFTPEQQLAIIGVIAGVGPLIQAILTRRKVVSAALVVLDPVVAEVPVLP